MPLPGRLYQSAEAPAGAAQEQMLVRVQVIVLNQAVVDVLHRRLDPDPVDAHRLELEHDERAQHVLQERLVDLQRDLAAGLEVALEQVQLDQLLRNVQSHVPDPFCLDTDFVARCALRTGTPTSSTPGYSSVIPAFLMTSPQRASSASVYLPSSEGPMCTA